MNEKIKGALRINGRSFDGGVSRKEKLTLSVNREVVEKAKKVGINISELTEKVLEGFTFEPTIPEKNQILKGYKELFRTMQPLMSKFGFELLVAQRMIDLEPGPSFYLWPDGFLCLENDPTDKHRIEEIVDKFGISDLLPPNKILENFIMALSERLEKLEKRKQFLPEIKAVQQIIKAVSKLVR